MAKSKNGGSRSYLRGRIGAEVYSIGKDSKGKKQQVVRSIAESVANPQTLAQMKQRMILGSVAQLARLFNPIVDHSFDGLPVGQPSISEFSRLAIAKYRADASQASPKFGYNRYGQQDICLSNVQVSQGKAIIPFTWTPSALDDGNKNYNKCSVSIELPAIGDPNQADLWPEMSKQWMLDNVFGGSIDNYLTFIGLISKTESGSENAGVVIVRFSMKPFTDGDTTEADFSLSNDWLNVEVLKGDTAQIQFNIQSGDGMADNKKPQAFVSLADNTSRNTVAVIFSQKTAKGYVHSTSSFADSWGEYVKGVIQTRKALPLNYDYGFDEALATYPVGTEMFLNGGDI